MSSLRDDDVPAPRPRNLSHIAIGVSDMDRSLAFYCGVIGLGVAVDQLEEMKRPEFRTTRRGVYLRWADGDDAAIIVLAGRAVGVALERTPARHGRAPDARAVEPTPASTASGVA